jgi:hypothetical protein
MKRLLTRMLKTQVRRAFYCRWRASRAVPSVR